MMVGRGRLMASPRGKMHDGNQGQNQKIKLKGIKILIVLLFKLKI
jgi:hypothetical protein